MYVRQGEGGYGVVGVVLEVQGLGCTPTFG